METASSETVSLCNVETLESLISHHVVFHQFHWETIGVSMVQLCQLILKKSLFLLQVNPIWVSIRPLLEVAWMCQVMCQPIS